MRFPLSEKTLELNILKNILQTMQDGGNRKAYLYGFSAKHESKIGLDAAIKVPGNPRFIGLQFKKAMNKCGSVYTYEFNNNSRRNQHNLLWPMARRAHRWRPIFYVLPLFEDTKAFARGSPNFVARAHFHDPIQIGVIKDNKVHQMIFNSKLKTMRIRSDSNRENVKPLSWEEISELILKREVGVKVDDFLEVLRVKTDEISELSAGEEKPVMVHLDGVIMPT